MKSMILMAAMIGTPAAAQEAVLAAPVSALQSAAKEFRTKADNAVVRDQTSTVRVDLNDKTVKCSQADYSMPMLKVLIPGLADLTVLNHRNTREGAPCVAAGSCLKIKPAEILKDGPGTDEVKVRVVLRKETAIEGEICRVSLVERVTTTIRGVPFFHERVQDVAERNAADCR